MNSMRWMCVAAALLLAPACKKDKQVEEPAATAPQPAEAANPAAEPGAAEPAEPAAADSDKDMVAVGSSGKEKVIATGSKTVADTEAYTVKLASPDKVTTTIETNRLAFNR